MRISDWSSDVCSSDLIDERRADPVLERADAAAERRLGQVARFGRAGKIAFISELDEVLEPHDIHLIPLVASIDTVPALASFEPLTVIPAPRIRRKDTRMSAPKTLYDKIVDEHRILSFDESGTAGDRFLLYIDRTVLNEYTNRKTTRLNLSH